MIYRRNYWEMGCRALLLECALYSRVRRGKEPAEMLPTVLRHRLVAELHHIGLTDVEIAERILMTTYTATRIREGLSLPPNRPPAKELSRLVRPRAEERCA